MFYQNAFLYMALFPLIYQIKLNIELGLSELIVRVASEKTVHRVKGPRYEEMQDPLAERIDINIEEKVESVQEAPLEITPSVLLSQIPALRPCHLHCCIYSLRSAHQETRVGQQAKHSSAGASTSARRREEGLRDAVRSCCARRHQQQEGRQQQQWRQARLDLLSRISYGSLKHPPRIQEAKRHVA